MTGTDRGLAHPVRCLLCRVIIEARDVPLHAARKHDADPWPDGNAEALEDPELMEAG